MEKYWILILTLLIIVFASGYVWQEKKTINTTSRPTIEMTTTTTQLGTKLIEINEKGDKYCKAFDNCQALSYILKDKFLSGKGTYTLTEKPAECDGCVRVYVAEYEWTSNGYHFKFVDDHSYIPPSNYVIFNKKLTIFSTEDKMLRTDDYPFLKCDNFVYRPTIPSVSFEIHRANGKTEIIMSMNTGMYRSYKSVLDHINEKFSNCNEPIVE